MKLSNEDLKEQLNNQIKLLNKNINDYDSGFNESAITISTICRIILHDTNNSKSLLTNLNIKKDLKFVTGINSYMPSNMVPFSKNVGIKNTIKKDTSQLTYYSITPKYKQIFNTISVDFDLWWNEIILRDSDHNLYTRKQIVLFVANKYGGAHIDNKIPDYFYNLEKNNKMGWKAIINNKTYPAENSPLFPLLRTIGFDLLLSLDTSLTCIYKTLNKIPMTICTIQDKKYFYLIMNNNSIEEKKREEYLKKCLYVSTYGTSTIYTSKTKQKIVEVKKIFLVENVPQ